MDGDFTVRIEFFWKPVVQCYYGAIFLTYGAIFYSYSANFMKFGHGRPAYRINASSAKTI